MRERRKVVIYRPSEPVDMDQVKLGNIFRHVVQPDDTNCPREMMVAMDDARKLDPPADCGATVEVEACRLVVAMWTAPWDEE